MNEETKVDKTRRNLVVATSVVGGAASVGAAVPFVVSMWPSERAKAAGAPVEVDISKIAPGEMAVIEWRGKPVWVIRRTKEMIESLKVATARLTDPESRASKQPTYAKNETRAQNPEWMVMEGVCTHLGCSPQLKTARGEGGDGRRLGRRLLLPVPRLQVRLRRPRVPRRAGAAQPRGAALHARRRQAD